MDAQNVQTVYDPAMRPKDASKYLGISLSRFWGLVAEGKVPQGRKLSAHCRVWRLSELNRVLDGQEKAEAEGGAKK